MERGGVIFASSNFSLLTSDLHPQQFVPWGLPSHMDSISGEIWGCSRRGRARKWMRCWWTAFCQWNFSAGSNPRFSPPAFYLPNKHQREVCLIFRPGTILQPITAKLDLNPGLLVLAHHYMTSKAVKENKTKHQNDFSRCCFALRVNSTHFLKWGGESHFFGSTVK